MRKKLSLHARRIASRRHKYGMSPEQYNTIEKNQNFRCAVCKQLPRGLKGNEILHVDHNHATGDVRGLLCTFCNHSLKENTTQELLQKVAIYLESPPAIFVKDLNFKKQKNTHCNRGHEMTSENTYTSNKNSKQCLICKREQQKLAQTGRKREKIPQHLRYNLVDTCRIKTLRHEYGISIEQYNQMYQKQEGSCSTCGIAAEQKKLVVDHNKSTLEVRGLLCNRCNILIGDAFDSPEILRELARYLDKKPAIEKIYLTNRIAVKTLKTHCIRGHEFTDQNTRIRKSRNNIIRSCRSCDAFHRSVEKHRKQNANLKIKMVAINASVELVEGPTAKCAMKRKNY